MPERRLRVVLGLIVLLLAAAGCIDPADVSGGQRTPTPSPTASASPAATPTPPPVTTVPVPPDGDRWEQAQRLTVKSATPIARVVNPNPVELEAGRTDTFWVADLDTHRHFQVQAELKLVSPNAYWYVDTSADIPLADLERSAQEFERHIWPTVTQHYGTPLTPGVDNDPRLTILNSRFRGAAGYYSSADEYPKIIHPFSNEREMMYIDVGTLRPGTTTYNNVLAHELQHAAHWRADPNEESWINEGLSVLAEDITGFSVGLSRMVNTFNNNPNVQLTGWQEQPRLNAAHYAVSYLFLKYLAQHYGGYDMLPALVEEQADSIEGIDNFLRNQGYAERFVDVFRDWVVANYASGLGIRDSRYRYPDADVRVRTTRSLAAGDNVRETMAQYAATYLEVKLPSGEAKVTFKGPDTVKLLPNAARSGSYQWWGNRGDSADTTLTREFDLTAVSSATLKFALWHETEKYWDWAYVQVSDDGGATWKVLQGATAINDNPVGNAYGPGYTGNSGGGNTAEWVDESVNLTPYAGKKVLVRFESITDEAVNLNGFAVDDISIPEINFTDDAEQDAGWDARGFVRMNNLVPQSFSVQVIEFGKDIEVKQVQLTNGTNEATFAIKGFGGDLSRAVVVVAALAPVTSQQATYELKVEQGP